MEKSSTYQMTHNLYLNGKLEYQKSLNIAFWSTRPRAGKALLIKKQQSSVS